MELKRISRRFVITGALIIWSIKYLIRPLHLIEGSLLFLFNIAPNLLGSFLIPFAAYWFFSGKHYRVARIFKIESSYDLRVVCLLGFAMLVVNEYLQLISFFGRTFDYYDILSSAIGLLSAYIMFGRLQTTYLQTTV